MFFFFKQKTAYEMRISDWSSDVCSSDLTYLPVRKLVRIEAALAEVKRRNVSGDIVEFGVALGGSAILLARETSEARRFFGLDVFAMIPPPTSEKDDPKSKTRYEAIASGQAQGLNGDPYYGYRDDLYEHVRSEEHTSELQSLMRISYAVFCLKKKKKLNKYSEKY